MVEIVPKRSAAAYYEKKMAAYSSLAKYGITILSAMLILFPSTYTFIRPPYNYDFILFFAFVIGVLAFVTECYVIIQVDFNEDSDAITINATASLGALLTVITLFLIFSYMFINVLSDRISPPRIIDLKYQPLTLYPGTNIEFTGKANDQRLDFLTWKWEVILQKKQTANLVKTDQKNNLKQKSDILSSNLKTAYWTAKQPGKYLVTVHVSDSDNHSSEAQLYIKVHPK